MPTQKTLSRDGLVDLAFTFCMNEEGKERYTDDPRDPGGPTKYGIALNYNRKVIPDKDGNGVIDARDVQELTEEDARRIYVDVYWRPNKCDMLPPALALMFADMVFNPGPGVAPKLLQQALNAVTGAGLVVDGKLGPATKSAVDKADMPALLSELAAQRALYYASRSGFPTYGKGWTRRTMRCLSAALRVHLEAA